MSGQVTTLSTVSALSINRQHVKAVESAALNLESTRSQPLAICDVSEEALPEGAMAPYDGERLYCRKQTAKQLHR